MNNLEFIAALVKALAWPLATTIIAIIFRSQISALLSRIRKGKIGPAEFEFEREVQELVDQTPAQLQAQSVGSPTVSLATTNPRAAILEAWLGLEGAINRLADKRQLQEPGASRSPISIIRWVGENRELRSADVSLFHDLQVLRNRAAHDTEFSPSAESVIKYAQLAQGLQARIEKVQSER
jgi:hypothetical protein